ncbi:nicotinate-nucleotide adenylyltransferase [Candidatus Chlorohelix sp.]|uniref:nicotinate-nucleotide adenylyltransferase n=1 Tax=Candidatus Chlorohelix sp. TaxID=3139201 RepID=UPI00305BE4A8
MQRIGIIGGTFDPIHTGHLIIAQEVAWRLGLDKVLFVPAGNPPHKRNQLVTEAYHRLEMVRLAIEGNSLFELSMVDAVRVGYSYTADMLEELSLEFKDSELYFIIGADAASELVNWHKPEKVLELAQLAVVSRPGYNLNLDDLKERFPEIQSRMVLLDSAMIQLAANQIRQYVQKGESIRYLVPPSVEAYIYRERLYSSPESSK